MDQLNVLKQALEALENGRRVRNCEGGTAYQPDLEDAAIPALRQAIQKQALQNLTDFDQQAEHGALIHEGTKQEPVAWMHIKTGVLRLDDRVKGADFEPSHWTPLYTAAPPPRKEKQAQPVALSEEWQACVKLPVTVHVRAQRPGETHVGTREGITPVEPDDLIMRGVSGEEYPIGRKIFEKTYQLGESPPPRQPFSDEQVAWYDKENNCAYTAAELDGETVEGLVPLYIAAPSPRQPLTDEEMYLAIRPLFRTDELATAALQISKDEYRAVEVAHGIKGEA